MKKVLSVVSLSSALVGLFASPVRAVTLIGPPLQNAPYLQASDSPFSTVVGFTYFHLETFEDDALNVPGVTIDNGSIIGPEDFSSFVDSVDADSGTIDGSGNGGRSLFGYGTVTFSFHAGALGGTLPTHAGIVWTDGQTNTFEAFDENGASLGTLTGNPADGAFTGQTAEDRFFGVINSSGISAIRMTGPSWELDHLQYGALRFASVPETGSTIAALLMGLLGIGAMSRKLPR